jgi:hypothetical protein
VGVVIRAAQVLTPICVLDHTLVMPSPRRTVFDLDDARFHAARTEWLRSDEANREGNMRRTSDVASIAAMDVEGRSTEGPRGAEFGEAGRDGRARGGLAAARGTMYALAIGALVWAAVGLAVWSLLGR